MAEIRRHRRAVAAALLVLAAVTLAPARAEDRDAKTDLYDRPVLAIDPGMHTAKIRTQAVDSEGRFAVTAGDDRTVRIWSLADGKLLGTIWIPVGPGSVGAVYAVAISPDGSTIAAGGFTETRNGEHPIDIFDRESGNLIRRISGGLPDVTDALIFSPDGRYLAATLGAGHGLRVFDRNTDWNEAFRDEQYRDNSYGASFSRDGRLATASYDGLIRFYQYDPNGGSPNFRPLRAILTPNGLPARGAIFSPDDKLLAIYYRGVAALDILDGKTFKLVGQQRPGGEISMVSWSRDSQTLFAAVSGNQNLVFTWDHSGLGDEKRIAYCANHPATGIDTLAGGRVLVASSEPCLGLLDSVGKAIWTVPSSILNLRWQTDVLRLSEDGKVVDFGYGLPGGPVLRFDVSSLTLSRPPANDVPTSAPSREGLTIGGWRDEMAPTLRGRALPFAPYDTARSLAVAPGAKRFFLGSSFALGAFDDAGAPKWRWQSRNEIWAVNASGDGRLVVTADGDGAIRWHRADDGRELLALQVLQNDKPPDEWNWVLWTPEGFYEATPGAEDVLRWVVNHGPDAAATTLPVSSIVKLHRPDALKLVLDELETKAALGTADIALARCDVQAATGSAKPPGEILHVLAIGVDEFGDRAGDLHLNYAGDDAREVASVLLASQKKAPCGPSLYTDVQIQALTDAAQEKPTRENILKAIEEMAENMRSSGSDRDVALVLVSTHGAMIGNELYLLPYGVDLTAIGATALSVTELAHSVRSLAEAGKVILLIDACHSGGIGPDRLDADVLSRLVTMNTVTVLTSSTKFESSLEDKAWGHGAFTKAFLDALSGSADILGRGTIRMGDLAMTMDVEVDRLTSGKQHLGPHLNFLRDEIFVDNR